MRQRHRIDWARVASDERKWRERERLRAIAAQPGGRGYLTRALLLDRERQVRASIVATTDDGERARLTANADELHRLADMAEHEAKEYDAMRTAQQIIENTQKRLREIAQRFALVREEDDSTVPPGDRAWRAQRRAELRGEWRRVENQAYAEATQWREAERQRNLALYHSDPVGDPAAETRRLREEQETASLAAQFIGQHTAARNRLLPEGREMLAAGNVDRARVILNAAKRVGVEDAQLEHAIKTTLDQTLPHRKQALEGLARVDKAVDDLRLSIVTERVTARVGTQSQQASDSAYRKMLEWRGTLDSVPPEGGAPSGDGSGAGTGATGGGASAD
jgi:hypothetical protein